MRNNRKRYPASCNAKMQEALARNNKAQMGAQRTTAEQRERTIRHADKREALRRNRMFQHGRGKFEVLWGTLGYNGRETTKRKGTIRNNVERVTLNWLDR